MTSVLIQFASFTAYAIYVAIFHGIQPSVSHSYYVIKEKWLFTLVMWVMGICQCLHADLSQWFFLSGAGLGFIGAANAFKDLRMTYRVHLVGTITAISGGVIAFFFLYEEVAAIAFLHIGIPYLINLLSGKRWVWWIECWYVIIFSILLVGLYCKGS